MRISDWSSDVCSSDLNGSLDASWELDLFGGARRGLEASQARLQAAQASWDEARVTLAAEVADAYVQRRYCAHLLVLYQDTLDSRRSTRSAERRLGEARVQHVRFSGVAVSLKKKKIGSTKTHA